MAFRRAVAGTVLTAALVMGGSTAALAQGAHAGGHKDNTDWCTSLDHRISERRAQLADLEAERADLVSQRADATAAGRAKEVRRLDDRIAHVDGRLADLEDRITELSRSYNDNCEPIQYS